MDLILHFVKANGGTSHKVFNGAELTLAPGSSADVKAGRFTLYPTGDR